jgi:hypothetical protein
VLNVIVVVLPSDTLEGLAVSAMTSGAIIIFTDFDSATPSLLIHLTENVVGAMRGSVVYVPVVSMEYVDQDEVHRDACSDFHVRIALSPFCSEVLLAVKEMFISDGTVTTVEVALFLP